MLHNFNATPYDGGFPNGVTISAAGVLLGTTGTGGVNSTGVVFALIRPATPGATWTEHILYTFQTSTHRPVQKSGVVIGSGGVLYGTTVEGGSGYGSVFALAPPLSPGGAWTETTIYSFMVSDGESPNTGVIIGGGGVLYGTTNFGGGLNGGTVYSLTPPSSPGGAWVEQVLHEFPNVMGFTPNPGLLTLGESGVLYGTTAGNGLSSGTVYALTRPATTGGARTELLLHTFTGTDGVAPTALVIGSGGVLYGTTERGGLYGGGTVFQLNE